MDTSYSDFLSTWESQQNALTEMREQRFSFMMDILEHTQTKAIKILDVGCGPGSFTIRLARRFPNAQISSIDYDPVLLRIARKNLSIYGSRIKILEYDLREKEWIRDLTNEKLDAIVSTTALHWIPKEKLTLAYENFYKLLKNGGIFMDGDHFGSNQDSEYILGVYSRIRRKISEDNLSGQGVMNWEQWWEFVANSGVFDDDLKERSKRYTSGPHDQNVTLEEHIDILKCMGFNPVGVTWQYLDNRVLFARK
jgi:trans-aconitate methyltransferase